MTVRELAYKIDPSRWVRDVLGEQPEPWQDKFMRSPFGSQIVVLTARQVGKTTTASWSVAHHMLHFKSSLSVIACPAQRQSAEAVRRVRDHLVKAEAKFITANVYGLELDNGSRVVALPGSDDSIRGLTVDGWIIADEAARLAPELITAIRPMRARRPQSRLAMLSTAWSRTDPFWQAWESEEDRWIRLKVTADSPDCPLTQDYLDDERAAMSKAEFAREYLGIPAGSHTSPFTAELYDQLVKGFTPKIEPGHAFQPAPETPAIPAENPFAKLRL